jgi:hypothetical protein
LPLAFIFRAFGAGYFEAKALVTLKQRRWSL